MKFCSVRLGLARSLVALSVSLTVVLSSHAFASLASSSTKSDVSQKQTDSSQNEFRLTSATATATAGGVLLQWRTNSAPDNLGFNVYRLKDGQRTRVNREIIPGALFAPGTPALMRAGYSYSWFDRGGTADSTYYIESVNVEGSSKIHEAISPIVSKTLAGFEQTPEALSGGDASATESTDMFEKYYPAAESQQPNSPSGTIQEQWAIAAQTALKIAIKKDGWYRVTQQEMVAAGFNPTVDIRNLRLFLDANEVAISTNQSSGQFGSGDYIEFYGRGLDIPTTDVRTYYLIAGTTPGKRVRGEIQLDGDPILPPAPTSTPPLPAPSPTAPQGSPASTPGPVLRDPIFYSWALRDLSVWVDSLSSNNMPVKREAKENDNSHAGKTQVGNAPYDDSEAVNSPGDAQPTVSNTKSANTPLVSSVPVDSVAAIDTAPKETANTVAITKQPVANASGSANNTRSLPVLTRAAGKFRKGPASKKRKRGKLRREFKQERNHANVSTPSASVASVPVNFDYTSEREDRSVYFVTVLNGDEENFFGQVITFNATNPASQTINTPNPDLTAGGTARLEIALQGVNAVSHQVSVEFNGMGVGSFSFFGYDPASGGHPVQVFNIPVTQLQNGANTIRFTPQTCPPPAPPCPDVSIVDYVKLTYPHSFRADAGALKFNLRGTQSRQVDGFATPSVRLIDYTDPLSVRITRPASAPSGPGFAITVPTSDPPSKPQRLLYAIADGQFDQPAGLSLNQPSTLNQGILSAGVNNGAYFLVVSHKNFIPSFAPLLSQRQSQQAMTAAAVDVEDVYDEFGYGVHGPQAIKDFLLYASTHPTQWVTKPRYVIFAGDASYDPRNYQGVGNFDLVPTKLVDATFNETADDDWLTDFDNDQIANIPVGRLPVRTVTEADKVISKIVNFAPANVPQAALLVADDPTGYYFNFETANDQVQSLVTPSLTVQKVYRRLEVKVLTGTISTNSSSTSVTGSGSLFTTELRAGVVIKKATGEQLGTVASILNDTSLTLQANSTVTYSGVSKGDATRVDIFDFLNQGQAVVNYSGHGNVNVWTGEAVFTSTDAVALTNGNKLSFVVVMDCLNGYFQDPNLLSMSEAFLEAPNGGAVAAFASSGLTFPDGQHQMSEQLYTLIYGAQPIALGDAIKIAKGSTTDVDVRKTWIFFGDPSIKIR